MIDLSHLKSFCAIVENGTMSKAAEALYTSQPAVSRSLKQLEDEIGVTLFSHRKNKIELNENGKLAYELAAKILTETDEFAVRLRNFDRNNRTISIGSCAPTPMLLISPKLTNSFPHKIISTQLAENAHLLSGLIKGEFQIIITNEPIKEQDIYSVHFCDEHLLLCVPREHILAKKQSGIFLYEVGNSTMLLYAQIGFWKNIQEQMPDTRFIMQSDFDNFSDLVQESNLLSFSSDLVSMQQGTPKDKVLIPILDDFAKQAFYLNILKKYRSIYNLDSFSIL